MEERLVPVIGRIAVPVAAFVVMLAACGGPGGAPGGGGGPRATVPIPTAQPLDVTVATDDSRATTQTVPTGGGTLKATAVDGTQYVLTIPSTALLAETTITMTPLSDVEGAPLAGTAHGVSLEPTGLRLYDFATLEIIPPAGSGTHVAGFGTQGQGRGFHLQPLQPGDGVGLKLMHFSEHGAFFSEVGPILVNDPVEFMPSDWESGLQQMLAELLLSQREAQLAGLPGDPDFDWKLEAILRTYYEKVILPLLYDIEFSCVLAKQNASKVLGWNRTVALVGKEEVFAAETANVVDAVLKGADKCWQQATEPCVDPENAARFQKVLEAARLNQLLGGNPAEYDPYDPDLQCELMWTGTITYDEERVTQIDETKEGTCCYGRPTSQHTVVDSVLTTSESWTVTGGTGFDYRALAHFTAEVTYERSEEHSHESWSSCSGEIVPSGGVDTLAESGSGSTSAPTVITISVEDDGTYWVSGGAEANKVMGTISGTTTSRFGPLCEGGYDEDSESYSYDHEWGTWSAYGYGTIDPANPGVLAGSETTVEEYENSHEVITRTVTWHLERVGNE